ncbi:replication initiation negative regulator SeqA [Corallincola platygyrae]|uniref:Negative modulator of initiation of replication n=1 Tax=Corallincola platygyrae TaxID=1193278 RepID=A0ABW4XJV6_9GAMM
MKTIEVDEDLYQFIASKTERIGESASDILRRLIGFEQQNNNEAQTEIVESEPTPPIPETNSEFEFDSQAVAKQKGAVGRFVYILSLLHQYSPDKFAAVLNIKGRNRVYFATSKATLLAAGSSTAPRQIPDSPYWVITNTNTGKKREMLKRAMAVLELDESLVDQMLQTLPSSSGKKVKK